MKNEFENFVEIGKFQKITKSVCNSGSLNPTLVEIQQNRGQTKSRINKIEV